MASLYELTEQYAQLLAMAEDPEIDPQVLADTMEALDGEIEQKADGCARVMRELEASAKAHREEARRHLDRARVDENSLKRISSGLQNLMMLSGKRKLRTELFNLSIAKNPDSVVIPDESRVPEQFLKAEIKIDKAAVKQALKDGQEFDWAHLEASEGLRIK